jgi:hypothetical protein
MRCGGRSRRKGWSFTADLNVGPTQGWENPRASDGEGTEACWYTA